jgi:transposase
VSNYLKVNLQATVRSLSEQGWSCRRIARELGINRRTAQRYFTGLGAAQDVMADVESRAPEEPKCTISIAGSAGGSDSKCTISTLGSAVEEKAKCTISIAGSEPVVERVAKAEKGSAALLAVGRQSKCAGFEAVIARKLEAGLSAQRIYQDLVGESGFAGSYQSVKRSVQKLKASEPRRVWRVESQPGEEMQVDFGLGAPLEMGAGKTRRSWVFRAVLSYSRKGYSEAVLRQDTETFLRCLENAVRSFGGTPLLVNLDNLKAAVLQADWFDPEVNPKLAQFCRHYGMNVLPCRPYTPQHKGKIERGICYVRGNALKGRRFASLGAQNLFLADWEKNVADTRIHGTTRQQIGACFEQERPHLQPLPAGLFPCYQEARRSVHRDSYVEVAKAYYEVPPEYIGRAVWARWDGRTVRILNERLEQIAMHTRLEPGQFSRCLGTAGWSGPVVKSCHYWIDRASLFGEGCGAWARHVFAQRGPQALRAIMALCQLSAKHHAGALDRVCARACAEGLWRYKDLRRLLEPTAGAVQQQPLPFAAEHPLIRDLQNYAQFIAEHAPPSVTTFHESTFNPPPTT